MKKETTTTPKRVFEGTVTNVSGKKTVRVRVERMKLHPKYEKHYRVSKHYLVHDEKGQCAVGDRVHFAECRPLSKTKRWRVLYGAQHI